MFTQDDVKQITERGASLLAVESQVERFRKGFPWMDIVAPATPERGIEVLEDDEIQDVIDYVGETTVAGACKFVPASGAASPYPAKPATRSPSFATRRLSRHWKAFSSHFSSVRASRYA